MKKIYVFGCVLAVCLFACSEDVTLEVNTEDKTGYESLTDEETAVLSMKLQGTFVSESDALQKATKFWGLTSSRTDLQEKVCRVFWVKYQSSLSQMSRTIENEDSIPVYLVNRVNGGSVLVAGDERLPEILAYSEEGELSLEKNGSGLDVFIDNLPAFISSEINRFEIRNDSLLQNVENISRGVVEPVPWQRLEVETTPWITTYSYPQLVSVTWNQTGLYNQKFPSVVCDNSTNIQLEHAYAGCVPVAISQILSFHKYPVKFGNTIVNWLEITRYPSIDLLSPTYRDQLQSLLYEIAEDETIEIEYDCSGTSSNIYCANAFFEKMGYVTDGVQSYQNEKVKGSISNSRPVYARGESSGSSSGHAWVIDGGEGKKRTRTERVYQYIGNEEKPSNPIVSWEWRLIRETYDVTEQEYVHCNWGYGGMYDGYYIQKAFNLTDDVWGDGASYTKELYTLTNIKRR